MKAYCTFCHQDNIVKLNRATEKAVCTVCTHEVELSPIMLNLLRQSKEVVYYVNGEKDSILTLAQKAIDKKAVKRIGKLCQFEERIFADLEIFVEALRSDEELRKKVTEKSQ